MELLVLLLAFTCTSITRAYNINCNEEFRNLPVTENNFVCPKNCMRHPGHVCGTDHYSEDSHVCLAAIHAGEMLNDVGGAIGVYRHGSLHHLQASEQNGIRSQQCDSARKPTYAFGHRTTSVVYYRRPLTPPGVSVNCNNMETFAFDPICPVSMCKNGGTCVTHRRHVTCDCAPGYTGGNCGFVLNSCYPNPCENSGVCSNGQNDFSCSCTPGFTGKKCEREISACYAGIKSEKIKNFQMTSSSNFGPHMGPHYARLDNPGDRTGQQGAWAPKDPTVGQYIQVDFLKEEKIYGVVTQGRAVNALQYMTQFKISYSEGDVHYKFIMDSSGNEMIFDGNDDRHTHKVNYFPKPVTARFFRLVAHSWHGYPSVRIEYLTC